MGKFRQTALSVCSLLLGHKGHKTFRTQTKGWEVGNPDPLPSVWTLDPQQIPDSMLFLELVPRAFEHQIIQQLLHYIASFIILVVCLVRWLVG